VARSLDAIGVTALIAVAGEGAKIVGSSKACTAAVDLEPSDPEAFCRNLVKWADSQIPGSGPIATIPLSDRLVEFLDTNRELFPDRFRLAIASHEVNTVLLDKIAALDVAARAGIDVPPWAHVRSEADLAEVAPLRLPLIIRPTNWAASGDVYFKFRVLRDPLTLEADLRSTLHSGAELLVQEYLEVTEDAVEFAITWRSADATRTEICTGRKRRASEPQGGVMAWGEAIELADVKDAAERFLDASGHTGPGGIELIRHNGRLWFVEFNPRMEAIHFLANAAGIDTARLTYQDLAGVLAPELPTQRPAAAWVGSAWLNRVRVDPKSLPTALADRWKFGRSPNTVRAVWDLKDPRPGIELARRIVRQIFRRGDSATVARHESGLPT